MAENFIENFATSPDPYIVGISLSPSGTFYKPQESFRNSMSISELGNKKKSTSFQITSVTVQGSRLSNEGGEESADDLDDSNADDFNSEQLDSSRGTECDGEGTLEDTREADGNSPSKSQEKLKPLNIGSPLNISVQPSFSNLGPTVVSSTGLTVVTTSASSISQETISDENWHHRFKVVKIVSREPFHRGRWHCMDFVDPPGVNLNNKLDSHGPSSNGNHELTNSNHSEMNKDQPLTHFYELPANNQLPSTQSSVSPVYGIILPVNGSQSPSTQNVGIQTVQLNNNNVMEMSANEGVARPQSVQSSAPATLLQPMKDSIAETTPPGVGTTNLQFQLNLEQIADFKSPQCDSPPIISHRVSLTNSSLHEVIPDALGTKSLSITEDETESSSQATNAVAIDNKIEQAMDLVKSHLMYAVREEVEDLKEKITELTDKISYLEQENSFLRSRASPETLLQLSLKPTPKAL